MTWPPLDTDRNRFTYRVCVAVGALATVYFLLFALQTAGAFPWAFFTVSLAGTLLAGVGLLLMREQRQASEKAEKTEKTEKAARAAQTEDVTGAGPPEPTHPGDAGSSSVGRAVGE